MKCLTEEMFMKCECERCKKYKEEMVKDVFNKIIYGMILESIGNSFNKKENSKHD
jgi:hypothetical protein